MSILIKGIDLPNSGQINMIIRPHGNVWIEAPRGVGRAEAIQIPTPHGRLVEEHYHGELKAKHAEGLFAVYRSADEDSNRFILEEEHDDTQISGE